MLNSVYLLHSYSFSQKEQKLCPLYTRPLTNTCSLFLPYWCHLSILVLFICHSVNRNSKHLHRFAFAHMWKEIGKKTNRERMESIMKFVCTWSSKICRIFYVRKWLRQRRQTVKERNESVSMWKKPGIKSNVIRNVRVDCLKCTWCCYIGVSSIYQRKSREMMGHRVRDSNIVQTNRRKTNMMLCET